MWNLKKKDVNSKFVTRLGIIHIDMVKLKLISAFRTS